MSDNSISSSKGQMPSEEFQDDRVLKDISRIPINPISRDKLFGTPENGMRTDLDELKRHLVLEGRLEKADLIELVRKARAEFDKEPNLLRLRDPVAVCGDIHGQFYDMAKLFEVAGDPANFQFLFLGDYVDRGCFSTEVVIYLFAVKINYPKTLFLLRGNHECRHLTSFFNFKDECIFKYDLEVYEEIMNTFDTLPVAACINGKFLCMHGGISPDIRKLDDINNFDRRREIPKDGPMCDLLWSDPFDENKEGVSEEAVAAMKKKKKKYAKDEEDSWFTYNHTRQCSFLFGVDAVSSFLDENGLIAIIRAHEAQIDGYKFHMKTEEGVPRVITVFSAPNYCDVYGNKGACLVIENEVLNIRQFLHSEHPYYLPNFLDIFSWSLPFVAEKVSDILYNVIGLQDVENDDEDLIRATSISPRRGNQLKTKVRAVTKMVQVFKTLRQENEMILQLKQLLPNQKLPMGLLRQGQQAIRKAVSSFQEALVADSSNEKRPPIDSAEAEDESKELAH